MPNRIPWLCVRCKQSGVARAGTVRDAMSAAILRHDAISPRCGGAINVEIGASPPRGVDALIRSRLSDVYSEAK